MDAMEQMEKLVEESEDNYGWLLDSNADCFFELRTDGKHQSPEVDFLAAKVYGYATTLLIVIAGFSSF